MNIFFEIFLLLLMGLITIVIICGTLILLVVATADNEQLKLLEQEEAFDDKLMALDEHERVIYLN